MTYEWPNIELAIYIHNLCTHLLFCILQHSSYLKRTVRQLGLSHCAAGEVCQVLVE